MVCDCLNDGNTFFPSVFDVLDSLCIIWRMFKGMQLQPTLFYAGQKRSFENGASAFERKNGAGEQAL